MSDTMWVNAEDIMKSYRAAGMECHILAAGGCERHLIVQEQPKWPFSKWHDVNTSDMVEVEEDFFDSYPQMGKPELARKVLMLQKNYDGARAEIKELKESWEDATRLNRRQSTTIRRLRGLCGEAAKWMKDEIIHESEEETELREQLDMASHR